jgi:hypothetical protein
MAASPGVHPNAPSVEALVETESELGFQLPHDYRNFLLSTNGGRTVGQMRFPIHSPQETNRITLHTMYGVVADKHFPSLLEMFEDLPGLHGTGLLAIGYDLGGGQICLSLSDGNIHFIE